MDTERNTGWNFGVGRWFGVPVRLHVLFPVFAVLGFYFCWLASDRKFADIGWMTTATVMMLLVTSCLLHELAHIFGATQFGAVVMGMEICPWGGSTQMNVRATARQRLLVYAAGPISNLAICGICFLILWRGARLSTDELMYLFHPFNPVGLIDGEKAVYIAKLAFWINWLIFLVNLLPVAPFDANGFVRDAIPSIVPGIRREKTFLAAVFIANFTGVLLLLSAFLFKHQIPNELVPTWLVLILLGIFVLFSSKRQADNEIELMQSSPVLPPTIMNQAALLEAEQDIYEFEDSLNFDNSTISDWLHQHKQSREADDREVEEGEDRKVDEILARVHIAGVSSISDHERMLLLRVSQRYKQRGRQGERTN